MSTLHALRRPFTARAALFALAVLCLALASCATPRNSPPLPEVNIGFAWFTQPATTAELLAGFLPEGTPRVDEKHLGQLDLALDGVLRARTSRLYSGGERYGQCKDVSVPGKSAARRVAALHYWAAVGQCMGVDFLVVPQIISLRERDGSEAGVITPAAVTMDIFLLNVRDMTISRSHFDETQTSLADNLLDAGKFVARGGKWISAVELASEGMVQAVEELGL